jgi:hypothetical protein
MVVTFFRRRWISRYAGARGFAVNVHGASAAELNTTTEFRASHIQRREAPEQRHVGLTSTDWDLPFRVKGMAMETSLQQMDILQQIGAWMKIYGNSFMGLANQRRE